MMTTRNFFRTAGALGLVLAAGFALAAETKPAAPTPAPEKKEAGGGPLQNVKFRNLGPAAGGGRISAIASIPGDPNTIYLGSCSGGVFKTVDSGLTWKAIFEKYPPSIGSIAIAPSNPSLVWVGTGEPNPRNNIIDGHGVYFSADAGATWRFLGLADAGQISKILIDPGDPNTVYVAVLGNVWRPNADRGVFRTKDGGQTWKKVLFVDDQTGASDLVMQPGNPMVLLAGMWQFRRFPWEMVGGGPGSGLWKSTDGGTT
ncbi:MAG TPA: sialidase family protein, partial [Thermoanaerobaculia bacterium]|nr:sialidase family protein [Thermoanaerobaculia bacterium]